MFQLHPSVYAALPPYVYTTLLAIVLLPSASLSFPLLTAGPITILSPTNKGFETRLKALNITVDKVLANPQLLTTVLKFHVLPGGAYLSKQFRNNQNVTTLLGELTGSCLRPQCAITRVQRHVMCLRWWHDMVATKVLNTACV
eukprot:GHUV01052564.1.p1 GENE.GHUV01052564.1~~GHUV01052564.1.p1  ORF type:complete len:143 (+),score=27.38 GHUV01052564.1:180-608(+)